MNSELKSIYDKAKSDKEFCMVMEATENCWVPGIFSDEITKIAFATMYKGWLLRRCYTRN